MVNFKIELQDAPVGRPYQAGDRVRGKVICHIPTQSKINDVSLVFKGLVTAVIIRKKMNGTSRRHEKHVEEITLFRDITPLYSGHFDMQPQTLEWPFDLVFPTTVSYRRATNRTNELSPLAPASLYCESSVSPLPPSYWCSNDGFTGSCDGRIIYSLKVKMNSSSLFGSKEFKQVLVVGASPQTGPIPDPLLTERVLPFCHWSSSSLRPVQHTFKQKMRRTFTSDPSLATPGIWFQPAFTLPSQLTRGQSVPLLIRIHHKTNTQNDPTNPTLVLTSLLLRLVSHASVRARGYWDDYERQSSADVATSSHQKLQVHLPLDGSYVTAVENWGLDAIAAARIVIRPDFGTWVLAHRHSLIVTATFKHLESGHTFESKTTAPFSCLPPYFDANDLPAYVAPPPPPGIDDELLPPAYGAAGASSTNSSVVNLSPNGSGVNGEHAQGAQSGAAAATNGFDAGPEGGHQQHQFQQQQQMQQQQGLASPPPFSAGTASVGI